MQQESTGFLLRASLPENVESMVEDLELHTLKLLCAVSDLQITAHPLCRRGFGSHLERLR